MLYSINEQNATVALQNVRSYGTEGREENDEGATFVAPTDAVHPYLLFRGQDIKDLHVHENAAAPPEDPAVIQNPPPEAAPPVQQEAPRPAAADAAKKEKSPKVATTPTTAAAKEQEKKEPKEQEKGPKQSHQQHHIKPQGGRGAPRPRPKHNQNNEGFGSSLLKRTERGVVTDKGPDENPQDDFDFQSNLEHFKKEDNEEGEAGDAPEVPSAYEKDDFFDSISCDALDKEAGRDNRLRGSTERQLNTETFGAVALNNNRRRRGRGGGRGRGRGGRGRGRGGRGRGRSSYGRGNSGSQRQSTAASS